MTRAEYRHMSRKRRTENGKKKMRHENWVKHFQSIRRRNKRDRQAKASALANPTPEGFKRFGGKATKVYPA